MEKNNPPTYGTKIKWSDGSTPAAAQVMTKKVEPKVDSWVGLDTMTPLQSHKPSLYSQTSLVFYIRTVNQTRLAFLRDGEKSLAVSH